MLKVYPAIFHEEDGYWVEFPDLEGCQTYGSTLEETMQLAQEALGLYLATLIENGENIPAPSSIKDINTKEIASYVAVDINRYIRNNHSVKKTLSIPAWLAKAAEREHLSLSKILQEGLRNKLGL